jgi:adenine-specific DNA glycosylase
LPAIEHGFAHFHLTLTPQPCVVQRWPKHAEEPGLLWLALTEAGAAALPAPIKTLLRSRMRWRQIPPSPALLRTLSPRGAKWG